MSLTNNKARIPMRPIESVLFSGLHYRVGKSLNGGNDHDIVANIDYRHNEDGSFDISIFFVPYPSGQPRPTISVRHHGEVSIFWSIES